MMEKPPKRIPKFLKAEKPEPHYAKKKGRAGFPK